MPVDVVTSVEILRPPTEVAACVSMGNGPSWVETASGATRMTLRNRGEPSGFSKMAAPALATAMRRPTARTSSG